MKSAIAMKGPARRLGAHKPLAPAQLQAVAGLFSVLSEPSRLNILQILQTGPASVSDLVQRLGMKQANVSKQLGMLLAAGVVVRRQEGNRAIYSIGMPLVLELCNVVCGHIARHASDRAAALHG